MEDYKQPVPKFLAGTACLEGAQNVALKHCLLAHRPVLTKHLICGWYNKLCAKAI